MNKCGNLKNTLTNDAKEQCAITFKFIVFLYSKYPNFNVIKEYFSHFGDIKSCWGNQNYNYMENEQIRVMHQLPTLLTIRRSNIKILLLEFDCILKRWRIKIINICTILETDFLNVSLRNSFCSYRGSLKYLTFYDWILALQILIVRIFY